MANLLLRSLGLLADEPTNETPPASVTPPSRSAAPVVTAGLSLSLTAVYSSVVMTSGMCSGLRIQSVRGLEVVEGTLADKPDPWTETADLIEAYVIDMMTDGNAFIRRTRNAKGTVIAWQLLNPYAVRPYFDKSGRKRFDVAKVTGGVEQGLTEYEIRHIQALPLRGHARSLGPIGHARVAISGILDTRDYASAWFRQSDVPTGVLTTDQRLQPGDAEAYKSVWKDSEYGVRVLGQGLSYSPIMLSPEEAQWLEGQKWGVVEIARLFGMNPDHLAAAVEGKSSVYTNANNIDPRFLSQTLRPRYLRKFETALSADLARGQVAKFITDDLTQPDAKTQAEIDQIYLNAKVTDVDEIRAARGLTPRGAAQ